MKNERHAFQDEVLGTMPWDEDEDGWVARVPGATFRIVLTGDERPDTRLLASARALSADSTKLTQQVESLLTTYAARVPGAADEVLALGMDSVHLTRPNRPGDGMIFFTGPDEHRVWRCDYVAGRPQDLGFDD